ncbi:MAG: protein kinase, partial [Gammaproteobacteria bacterium]|nr:protein kinase [Gammaproteobacteria bacterium]
ASGSLDHTIKLWDVAGGSCVATLSGHQYAVNALTFLPDGRLASGSVDNTIKLWDVGLRPSPARAAEVKLSKDVIEAVRAEKVTPTPTNAVVEDKQGSSEEKASREEALARQVAELQAKLEAAERGANEPKKSPEASLSSSVNMTSAETQASDTFEIGKGLESLFIAGHEVTLGREIGRGGFGIVYEGTYAFEPVAVKTYYGTRLPEKEAREMRHEIEMMQKLQSRFLVRLLGLVQEPNSPAMLVMEYGTNGSLYNFLHSEQTISWGLRLRMAEELARGLGYLHQKQIVHGDIKSLNIVLDQDFHAKWCDFGLAVLKLHTTTTSQQEGAGSMVGTLRWMAPELFARKTSSPSTASDIWALGMVYFELASRHVPFAEARDNDQVKDFIKEATGEEIPEECQQQAPEFGELMQRCWAERSRRPTAAEVVTHMSQLNGSFVESSPRMFAQAKETTKTPPDSGYMDFSRR